MSSDFDEDNESVNSHQSSERRFDFSMFRSGLTQFSRQEDDQILSWIVKYKAFHLIKMNTIWIRMAKTEFFEGRPWQLMKKHFMDNIFPFLNRYRISKCDQLKLKASMEDQGSGILNEDTDVEVDDSSSDGSVVKPIVKRFESTREKRKRGEDDSSDTEDSIAKKVRRLRRSLRKYDKVPAEKSDYMSSDTSSVRSGGSTPSSPNDDGLDDGVVPPATGRQSPRTPVTQRSRESFIPNGNNNGVVSRKQIPRTPPGATGNSILRKSSQAQQSSMDMSRLSDQHMSDSVFVDQDLEVPSAEQFRAGLRYVAERMSNHRELSVLGVTSTVRKGGGGETRNIGGGSISKVMETEDTGALTEQSPNVEEEVEGRSLVIDDIAGSQSGPSVQSSSRKSQSLEKGFKAPDEVSGHSRNPKNPDYPHRRHQSPNLRNRTANFDEDDFSGEELSEDEKERGKETFEIDLGFGKKNEIFIKIKGLLPKGDNTKNIVVERVDRGRKIKIKGFEKEFNKTMSKLPKRKEKKKPFRRTNITYP